MKATNVETFALGGGPGVLRFGSDTAADESGINRPFGHEWYQVISRWRAPSLACSLPVYSVQRRRRERKSGGAD